MVGETADPVLLSSRAGGRWLTAGAFVLEPDMGKVADLILKG
jgi:hypothetical protein